MTEGYGGGAMSKNSRTLSILVKLWENFALTLFLVSALSLSISAQAAVTYDGNAASFTGTPGGASITASVTLGAGTNRIFIVTVRATSSFTPLVYFGSQPMIQIRSDSLGNPTSVMFYLLGPPTTATTLYVWGSGGYYNPIDVTYFSYQGVDQTTPGVTNNGVITGSFSGSGPSTLTMSATVGVSTSSIVYMNSLNTGGNPASTGYSSSTGTTRHSHSQSLNSNNVNFGFGDYAPGTTSAVNVPQTWATAANGSQWLAQWFELRVAAPVGTSTDTPSVTPTSTPTVTPTSTRTVTPSATPTFSASPTPSMPLVKTSNLANATIGDTITFCIAYTNNSSATQTIKVWDTISSFLTYIACNNSCTKSGSVVSWSVAGVAAGGTGSVCFWGTVNGYPFMPELMQVQVAALRDEDLEFLFAPIFSRERED